MKTLDTHDPERRIFLAKTLEELGEKTLELFLDSIGQRTLRNTIVASNRFRWVNGRTQTLEEIGRSLGVTRERVRQIERSLGTPKVIIKSTPSLFQFLSKLLKESNGQTELLEKAINLGYCESTDWSLESIMELATVLDQNAFLEELTDFKMQKVDFLDDPRSTVSIRNLRNGMGLIDMQVISDEISVSRELLHNKIRNIYPRSLFAEEISLLRGTLTTTFENTIGRQLEIRSPLDASELVIGIRKESRKRRIILTFSDRMLESFIQNVYGDPVNMDEFIKISGPPEPFAKIDLWIIDKLKNSDSGFLHYQQWVKLAIEDGVKVGSVMMYLSSSPYLRSLGHGVTSLVGHSYSEVEVKNYRDLILNSSDKTEVQLVFEDEDIFVHLRPSLSNFASGVVIIKREIADIVRGRTFSIHCKCQSLHSTSNLELNSTSFWTGFNPILTHGREVHYLKVSQLFRIQLDFEQNTATLII